MSKLFEGKYYRTTGHIAVVKNKGRKFGSSAEYLYVRVFVDGKPQDLLFTDNEIIVAKERAAKNPEDCPKPKSLLQKILSKIGL